jgi:hypothetical protein
LRVVTRPGALRYCLIRLVRSDLAVETGFDVRDLLEHGRGICYAF